jgi:probable phosphoglycerate mutase
MRELWLIRHAETEWSVARRHTGRTDIPLATAGREHAAALAPRLADHPFALVLVSPLSRARQTAELAGLSEHAQPRDDLMEWDYGAYEGITTAEIRERRPGWSLWHDGCPEGEQAAGVGARVDRVIAEALAVADDEADVACVAHSHVLRVLAARWLEQAPAFGARLVLDTASVSRLGFEHGERAVRTWNA